MNLMNVEKIDLYGPNISTHRVTANLELSKDRLFWELAIQLSTEIPENYIDHPLIPTSDKRQHWRPEAREKEN